MGQCQNNRPCVMQAGTLVRGMFLALAVLVMGIPDARSEGGQTTFDAEYDFLRRQSIDQVGREALVEAFRGLIDRYPDHSRTAEAMFDVANLYELTIRDQGIERDRPSAMRWFRRAADTAEIGSKFWVKIQIYIANRLSYADPHGARNVLRAIQTDAPDYSLGLAKVEDILQSLAVRDGDLDQAEVHCMRLFQWYDDRARIPQEDLEKADVDALKISAGRTMIEAFRQAPWPVEVRIQRIRRLLEGRLGSSALQTYGSRAIAQLKQEAEKGELARFDQVIESPDFLELPRAGTTDDAQSIPLSRQSAETPVQQQQTQATRDQTGGRTQLQIPLLAAGVIIAMVCISLVVLILRKKRPGHV